MDGTSWDESVFALPEAEGGAPYDPYAMYGGSAPYDPTQGGSPYPGEEGFVNRDWPNVERDPRFNPMDFWNVPPGSQIPGFYNTPYDGTGWGPGWDLPPGGQWNYDTMPPPRVPPPYWQELNRTRNVTDLQMYVPFGPGEENGFWMPYPYNIFQNYGDWGYPEGEGPGGYTPPADLGAALPPPPEWYEPTGNA